MKPERFVAVWVAFLFVCVLSFFARLLPWPAALRGTWTAGDWAAWVQAIGSIAAIGAGALAIRWQVAQESRREAVRDLKSSLQEVTEIRELVVAAFAQARADHASCLDMEAVKARALDESVQAQSAALFIAFQEAHLDHIRSMKVRLIFVRARRAFGSANQLAEQLAGNVRSSVQFGLEAYVHRFDMPLMLLSGSVNQLNREISELQARLQAELGA
jgi:hypothetical protein